MSTARLLDRVPSAVKLGTAVLQKHQLKFHKISDKDGSAKCDVMETGNPDHCVNGVVFSISESDKQELGRIEGRGYEEKQVVVALNDGNTIKAFTYYATHIDSELKPFHWYKEHVLKGARENGLAKDYINKIEAIESIDDPDVARHERELNIYR